MALLGLARQAESWYGAQLALHLGNERGGESEMVVGTDFATVSADGGLASMTGFIDRAPAGLAGGMEAD